MIDREFASQVLKRTLSAGADQAEVYVSQENALSIDVLDQKLESSDTISSGGISIRVIKDNRLGFSYTASFDDDSISELIGSAIHNSRNTHADQFIDFPESPARVPEVKTYDRSADVIAFGEKLKIALQIEKSAYEHSEKIKKTEKVNYSESVSGITLVNSKGVNASYRKSMFFGSADVVAEDSGLSESAQWFKASGQYAGIDPVSIGSTASRRAVMMLGSKPIKSGKMNVVFSPFTASMMISAIFPALSAESVIKGKSLFAGKLIKKVASPIITLIDDATIEHGVGSYSFDAEGSPAQKSILINNGILLNFICDHYNGRKLNASSTGNSVRMSFKTPPTIGPSNFHIKNGQNSGLLSKVSSGLLLESVIGAHTINPISGDFSIGAIGCMIENGKITQPVRGITIAGNLIEFLSSIEDIGTDLEFFGNIGSPSLLVPNVSISGENK